MGDDTDSNNNEPRHVWVPRELTRIADLMEECGRLPPGPEKARLMRIAVADLRAAALQLRPVAKRKR
ncbi:hypothetical protein [Polymorphobacter sp.]|uniref:hypothetical protein n=1 Tax=Polymorphobacter sp. TaxID=1909290 RepID=UPI003F706B9B